MGLFTSRLDGNSVLLLVPAFQFMKIISFPFAFFFILTTLSVLAPSLTSPPLSLTVPYTWPSCCCKAFFSYLHMASFFLLFIPQLRYQLLRQIFLTFLTQSIASSATSLYQFVLFFRVFSPAVIISYIDVLTNVLPVPSSLECQPHSTKALSSLFTAVSPMTHHRY